MFFFEVQDLDPCATDNFIGTFINFFHNVYTSLNERINTYVNPPCPFGDFENAVVNVPRNY